MDRINFSPFSVSLFSINKTKKKVHCSNFIYWVFTIFSFVLGGGGGGYQGEFSFKLGTYSNKYCIQYYYKPVGKILEEILLSQLQSHQKGLQPLSGKKELNSLAQV